MRKTVILFSAGVFAFSFLFLYFHPAAVQALQAALNTADLMFPFSIYRGIVEHTSGPDWVFGGYTPFLELAAGFAIWLVTRSIQLTYVLYAILQPAVVALCLVFLESCLVGKNRKMQRLVVISAAAPILVYATGHLPFLYAYFSWYLHITTACMALLVCGLSIQYLTEDTAGNTAGNTRSKNLFRPALLYLFAITAVAVLSDPIFLSQSVVPIIALIAGLVILRVISFRRGAAAGLSLLYAAAAGLAMYQLPRLWGSDRIVLYGSYMKPALDRMRENWPVLLSNLSGAFEGQAWIAILAALFYILCLAAGLANLRALKKNGQGRLRKRLAAFYFYLVAQMVFSIGASLIANDPTPRYYYPVLFFPLFWGWPFLLAALPGWMKGATEPARREARRHGDAGTRGRGDSAPLDVEMGSRGGAAGRGADPDRAVLGIPRDAAPQSAGLLPRVQPLPGRKRRPVRAAPRRGPLLAGAPGYPAFPKRFVCRSGHPRPGSTAHPQQRQRLPGGF